MDEYRISEAASRTGFSPSALRYYEKVGLIPEPERTPSGYRVFTDRHLEILGFIARAKRLGLPLEEIRVLAEAWSTGDCRATREQLLTSWDRSSLSSATSSGTWWRSATSSRRCTTAFPRALHPPAAARSAGATSRSAGWTWRPPGSSPWSP